MFIAKANGFFLSNIQLLKWETAFTKLEGLSQLEDDWDGEEALKPDPELISAAKRWLTNYKNNNNAQTNFPPSRILASPDGDVVFQWVATSSRRQIEFLSPYRAEWSLIDENLETQHGSIDLTDSRKAENITISDYYQQDIDCKKSRLYSDPKITNDVTWSSASSYPI